MSLPTSDEAKWVARLMRRKMTTHWNAKEKRVFRQLVKDHFFDDKDALAIIEQYYAFERKKGRQHGIYRGDTYTFLNNAVGELDRARDWREQHPLKPLPKKIIQMPPIKSEPFVESSDPADQEAHRRFMLDYLQRKQGKTA